MPIVAKSAPADSDMESLYEEEAVVESPETPAEESGVEGHTELVTKKLLMGKDVKPGDKVILTVVKDYGDEVELKYETESSDSEETAEMTEDEELDMLSA